MDDKSISLCGRVADTLLGERLNGIQEVSGSIPLISTKTWNLRISGLFLYFLVEYSCSILRNRCFLANVCYF